MPSRPLARHHKADHMLKERYYIKIIPHRGETVHRFALTRFHLIVGAAALGVLIFGSMIFAGVQVARAHAQMAYFTHRAHRQHEALTRINRQTDALRTQLTHLQKQNSEIQRLIGVKVSPPGRLTHTSREHAVNMGDMETRLAALSRASAQTVAQSARLRVATLHMLNVQHMHALERARELAAIPSINPIKGGDVIGCFCYRTYPDVEFHEGVDIAADYGTPIRASAAGTVVAAGYDGGYGLKVDIDHGNGYHTWYAHLSLSQVHVGEHVYKGEQIGLAGATGFATGSHLHYQIMHFGVAIDPSPYLHGVPPDVVASLP